MGEAVANSPDQSPPGNGGGRILQLTGITKTFPGVKALDEVNFDVREGATGRHGVRKEGRVETPAVRFGGYRRLQAALRCARAAG